MNHVRFAARHDPQQELTMTTVYADGCNGAGRSSVTCFKERIAARSATGSFTIHPARHQNGKLGMLDQEPFAAGHDDLKRLERPTVEHFPNCFAIHDIASSKRGERWTLLWAIDFYTPDEEGEKRGLAVGTPHQIVATARLFSDYLEGSHVKSSERPSEVAP
jgi:hypothetical protein